ncbi:phage antirepressor [uncultured Intestinimonas sp.]|uniref:phage antirepressor n=1 Tax=uncultured Intestinimonas sp. TaxID=1689265 RepID=UPI0025DFE475|nr:phage antirepressor [uncultured Intestinimonas sp.]
MNELMIFNNPEFGEIRTVEVDGEPWLVGKDVARALGYSNPRKALADHVDEEDKGVTKCDTLGGSQEMTIINESGLYSLVLSSKLPGAKKFRRWVTAEVLPSIRRTGGYQLPKDYLSALRALVAVEEEKLALRAENEQQRQAIAEFEPVRQYVDTILSSPGTMATTQIAADYDMSAKQLNKILHEEGLQHCVNGQWILYRQHMGKGYTKSETIPIVRSDGRPDTRLITKWTQKGRLLIHEILGRRDILAVMDRNPAEF